MRGRGYGDREATYGCGFKIGKVVERREDERKERACDMTVFALPEYIAQLHGQLLHVIRKVVQI